MIISVPAGQRGRNGPPRAPGGLQAGGPQKGVRSELKSREQILKERKKQSKQNFLQSGGLKKKRGASRQNVNSVMKSGFGRGGNKKGKMRKRM